MLHTHSDLSIETLKTMVLNYIYQNGYFTTKTNTEWPFKMLYN